MTDSTSNRFEIWGYALWVVGILLFAVSAARNRDPLSFIASVLFFVGIIVVMVPMVRRRRIVGPPLGQRRD